VSEPAQAGGSAEPSMAVTRYCGFVRVLNRQTWGLRPRLYSATCFAGSAHKYALALSASQAM